MNVFGNPQLAQVLLWIYGHDAHLSQQPSYSFRPNQNAKPPYKIYHTQDPFGRTFQKLFIHTSHQFQIFRIFWYRLIIHVAPIYIQKLTLPANTDSRLGIYHFFEGFSIPNCSETRLQKSTSTSNRPIFSYRAFSRFMASSSGAFVEKISAPREINSRFQFEIIWGCTSNRLASSLRVSCSLIASRATWALKAALCFFLVVDIMSKFKCFC